MDADLQNFVVAADDEVIDGEDEGAHARYLMDMQRDDELRTRRAMEAAIFGQNRKRKRGDVIGGFGEDEDADDFQKRKQERL